MMQKQIRMLIVIMITLLTTFSCKKEIENRSNSNNNYLKNSGTFMEMSYKITTQRTFKNVPDSISDLDFSTLNPRNDKHSVQFLLYGDGTPEFHINKMEFSQQTNIKHNVVKGNFPEVWKIDILGSTINNYDKSGNLLYTGSVPFSKNMKDKVEKLKKIGKKYSKKVINQVISSLQGQQLVDNLNEFIAHARQSGLQVTDYDNNMVSIRMIETNLHPNKIFYKVILIDKIKNKLVGTRIYDSNNVLINSTLFAYNHGKYQSLKAIRTVQKFRLPSGTMVDMITLSKIEDFNFKLNL